MEDCWSFWMPFWNKVCCTRTPCFHTYRWRCSNYGRTLRCRRTCLRPVCGSAGREQRAKGKKTEEVKRANYSVHPSFPYPERVSTGARPIPHAAQRNTWPSIIITPTCAICTTVTTSNISYSVTPGLYGTACLRPMHLQIGAPTRAQKHVPKKASETPASQIGRRGSTVGKRSG